MFPFNFSSGDYQTESFLEYIGLHLDATYGCTYIWKELDSCFLKLKANYQYEYEMDHISIQKIVIIQMHSIRSLILQSNFQICFKIPSLEAIGIYSVDGGLEGLLA